MTVAAFLLMLALALLGGLRLAIWIYGGSKHDQPINKWLEDRK